MNREFTGVFIPAHIWTSKELIPAEKMMLGEIDALSKSRGYCDASRAHFAEWLSCTVQNITYYLDKLERMGFISIQKIPGYRSRITLIPARFYEDHGVNGTDGGGKSGLRVGVNGTDGGGKWDLPEIKEEIQEGKEDIYIKPKKIETIDEAETLIKAWINEGNIETVKSWYDQSMKHYVRSEFLIQLTKFCSNYLNTSDKGRHFNFVTDPVRFFINGFRSWILTTDSFTRNQTAPAQSKPEAYKPLSNVIG